MAVLSCPECGGVEHQSRLHDLMCWACGHFWAPSHDEVSAPPPRADTYDKKGALVTPEQADPTPPASTPWVDPHAPEAGEPERPKAKSKAKVAEDVPAPKEES